MKKYNIIILPLAEDDIINQTDYIAFTLKSPQTALNISIGIRKSIDKLLHNPVRHELDEDEELASIGIRKQYYKNYKIYYLIDEIKQTVYILRVLHMLVDSKSVLLRMFK
jgi:plasmid stabilization system protein ParE